MKVLLVDDHAVVRAGVRRLLASEAGISIVEAETSRDAVEAWRREQPNLIILDLNLTDSSGLELLRRLIQLDKSAKILVLSMHSEPVYAARALQAGARGYVSKSAGAEEFVNAVRQVGKGGHYVEREIAAELAIAKFSQKNPLDQLTTREVDILRLLGQGKSYSQIAAAVGVSYKTVANTSSLMKQKLSVETTADLIRLSIENRKK
jgi:two-component system, NarL family, invasion response regulator UvrY